MCGGCLDAWPLLVSQNPMDEKVWMDAEWVEWLSCVLPFCERELMDEELCTYCFDAWTLLVSADLADE